MIDLSIYTPETEEVKIGEDIIHIAKPNELLTLQMMKYLEDVRQMKEIDTSKINAETAEQVITKANNTLDLIIADILNNNVDNMKFTAADVKKKVQYQAKLAFVDWYMKWANNLVKQDF